MCSMCKTSQEFIRYFDMFRNGSTHYRSEFYQYFCCNRYCTDNRNTITLCECWFDFAGSFVYWNRFCFKRWITRVQKWYVEFFGGIVMNIALIAHDAKKILMQNFCIAYRGILCKNELFATG